MATVVGVDIGTYEAKGVVVDESGAVVATATRAHRLSIPGPGRAEHDADAVWWAGFVAIVKELLADPNVHAGDVAAVTCSGIGPCVLPIDADGRPLRPAILYGIDTRAAEQIEELTDRLGAEEILARGGNALSSQSAGPKIAWLRRHEPGVFAGAVKFVTCQSYLVGRLTGEWVIDHGTAAYFDPFYDIRTLSWNLTGIDDFVDVSTLPRLAWAGDVVGTISPDAAAITGLAAGTRVLAGAADAPVEALSAAVINTRDAMVMYGSSHFLIQVVDRPVVGTSLYTAPFVFEGSYVLAGGTSTAGSVTRWFADLVGRSAARDPDVFADLAQEAASSPPGARGLLALPHFSGERTPHHDPSLTGGILGLRLSHSRADIYRALLEGIARTAADVLAEFESVGYRPSSVAAVGGGTRNATWLQAVSDMSGHSQAVVAGTGASYGGAMLAALAAGFVDDREALRGWVAPHDLRVPRPEYTELYREHKILMDQFRAATAPIARDAAALDRK